MNHNCIGCFALAKSLIEENEFYCQRGILEKKYSYPIKILKFPNSIANCKNKIKEEDFVIVEENCLDEE
ncbi:hypothetical protein M0R19_05250 [Candidatus Pacearchaeota archaeon]|jgi:hypothetical protein|nr:hypothetical protein [Candidatus Pacearchaeota archaeon]